MGGLPQRDHGGDNCAAALCRGGPRGEDDSLRKASQVICGFSTQPKHDQRQGRRKSGPLGNSWISPAGFNEECV